MKRQVLVERIRRAAQTHDLAWEKIREGGRHEIWQCGSTRISIPRHREINERTVEGIRKDLEEELGARWWR